VLCAVAYWFAGMTPFDAIGESFSTLSTGGFSTHDTSFAFYHSSTIQIIAIVFMLLGATNFGLHFQFMRRGRLSIYYKDPEWRGYLLLLIGIILLTTCMLLAHHHQYPGDSLLQAAFTVVSVSTTTGFSTVNFSAWPAFLPVMIMFVALLGGCSGSTSGGIKMIRCLLLKEQSKRELKRLVHPQAVYSIKMGDHVLPEKVVEAIWGFVAMFVFLFVVMLLILMATGLDLMTAFSSLASCFSNTGAAIGSVHTNMQHLNVVSKWVLIFAMLAGRLEIFTILVLFTPEYWRK
jgi:trk system potassium uptake protein TrkH